MEQWDTFYSQFLGIPLSVSFNQGSILRCVILVVYVERKVKIMHRIYQS